MTKQNENQGFGAGWQQLRLIDTKAVKQEIMQILGVTTEASFHNYKRGRLIPDRLEAEQIENVFRKYGITEIWGKAIKPISL